MISNLLIALNEFIHSLDYSFVISYVLFNYLITKDEILGDFQKTKSKFWKSMCLFLVSIPNGIRFIVTGFVYSFCYYMFRELKHKDIEIIINSFIFAVVTNNLIIESILSKIKNIKNGNNNGKNQI